jgi:hypothetical protein
MTLRVFSDHLRFPNCEHPIVIRDGKMKILTIEAVEVCDRRSWGQLGQTQPAELLAACVERRSSESRANEQLRHFIALHAPSRSFHIPE